MEPVYKYTDYKDYLRAQIRENRLQKAYRSRLAEAAGCQKSFLSQVLNAHIHLTPDHGANLCRFWSLTEDEATYFLDLLGVARASSPDLKRFLEGRMRKLKRQQGSPTEKLQLPRLDPSGGEEGTYFSSWYWSAIHVAVAVPKHNTARAIAERLALPLSVVERALKWLEEKQLIRKTGSGWAVTENYLHLPSTSPMNEIHQYNWRLKAMSKLQSQDESALHYSAVFALKKSDYHELREMIVGHIRKIHELVGPSPSEEIVAFTCDLFRV